MILAFVHRPVLPAPRVPDGSGVSRAPLLVSGSCMQQDISVLPKEQRGESEVVRLEMLTDAGQEVGETSGC